MVPRIYSFVNPLVRPRRVDLTICGSQIDEYVIATKNIESIGDKITRTMNVRNTNNINPKGNELATLYIDNFRRT